MYLISTAPYLFSSVPSAPRNIREAGRTEEGNEEEVAALTEGRELPPVCRLIVRPAGVQIVADLLLLAVEHAAAVEGDGVVRPRRLECLEVVRVLDPGSRAATAT